jgi:hypothetical protein
LLDSECACDTASEGRTIDSIQSVSVRGTVDFTPCKKGFEEIENACLSIKVPAPSHESMVFDPGCLFVRPQWMVDPIDLDIPTLMRFLIIWARFRSHQMIILSVS